MKTYLYQSVQLMVIAVFAHFLVEFIAGTAGCPLFLVI